MINRNHLSRPAAILAGLTLLLAVAPPRVEARGYGRSPSYSAWSSNGNYRYSKYQYYSPVHGSYRSHVAVYYPSQPRYVYYYNPYKRRYWGRYDLQARGYSTLAVEDRRENLADIPDSAFPEPGAMPTPEDGEDPLLPPVENLPPSRPQAPAGGLTRPPVVSPVRPGPSCHGY